MLLASMRLLLSTFARLFLHLLGECKMVRKQLLQVYFLSCIYWNVRCRIAEATLNVDVIVGPPGCRSEALGRLKPVAFACLCVINLKRHFSLWYICPPTEYQKEWSQE